MKYDYTERSLELADQLLSISVELREHLKSQQAEQRAASGRRRLGLLPGGRQALQNVQDGFDPSWACGEQQLDCL